MNAAPAPEGSGAWYARPVVCVADLGRALAFYVEKLGFGCDWSYDEEGRPVVTQVSRRGCELILSAQWPERVGHSLIFISLDPPVLDTLRAEWEAGGVAVQDGSWGYRLMVVQDPDGNTLYFPYEAEADGSPIEGRG